MREIKIKYVYKEDESDKIEFKIFSIIEIESNLILDYGIIDGFRHTLIDRLQYTGLKDKNGVEIYEGDIVKYGMFNTNCEVRYFKNSFVMWSIYGDYSRSYLSDDVEVIGNIYENKELLE